MCVCVEIQDGGGGRYTRKKKRWHACRYAHAPTRPCVHVLTHPRAHRRLTRSHAHAGRVGQWGGINAHTQGCKTRHARARGSTIIISILIRVRSSHLLVANGVTVPGACPRSPSVLIEHPPIPCHVQLLVGKKFGILWPSIPPHYSMEAGGPGKARPEVTVCQRVRPIP